MSKQRIFIAGHRGMVGSAIKRQLERFAGASLKVKAETSAKNAEKFDNDVDEIKRIFGDDIVIVE